MTAGGRGRLTPLRTPAASRVGGGRTRGQRGPPRTPPLHPVASSTSPRRESSPEVQPRACDPGVTSAWPDHSAAWPHSRAGQILRMFPGQTLWVTLCTRGQRRAGVWGRKAGRGDRAGPPSRPHTMGGLAGSATPHSPGVPMARSARWPWPVSRTRRPKSQVLCSLSPPPKLNSGDSRWFRWPTTPGQTEALSSSPTCPHTTSEHRPEVPAALDVSEETPHLCGGPCVQTSRGS